MRFKPGDLVVRVTDPKTKNHWNHTPKGQIYLVTPTPDGKTGICLAGFGDFTFSYTNFKLIGKASKFYKALYEV